jgi:hypothetical protein
LSTYNNRTPGWRRFLRRILLPVLSMLPALGMATPLVSQNDTPVSIDSRIKDVRRALQEQPGTSAEAPTEESPARPLQWANWPNWHNWNNWPNWPNWGNWSNY